MNLPLEITRLVIGEATRVPAAFDTSFKSSISEDVETVANAIRESMKFSLFAQFSLSLCTRNRLMF